MERLESLTDEYIIELGRKGYSDYTFQASNSDVPVDFFKVSRAMSLDLFPESSWRNLSLIMLGEEFESESDAQTAIKYAEAVSKLKTFHGNIEQDEDGPIISDHEIREARLAVGLAVLNERDEEVVFDLKNRVEEYFEDPVSHLKIRFLVKQLDELKTH